MPWHPVLSQLRDALADLYSDKADALRIAAEAGLTPSHVAVQGKGINTWHLILEEAEKQLCTEALIRIATREYPRTSTLGGAVTSYRAWVVSGRFWPPPDPEPAAAPPPEQGSGASG